MSRAFSNKQSQTWLENMSQSRYLVPASIVRKSLNTVPTLTQPTSSIQVRGIEFELTTE